MSSHQITKEKHNNTHSQSNLIFLHLTTSIISILEEAEGEEEDHDATHSAHAASATDELAVEAIPDGV